MKKISTAMLMFSVALGISITLSFIAQALGISPYLKTQGVDYPSILLFCLIFGFAGSTLSLLLSKWMVKRSLRIEVIDPSLSQGDMRWLYETVRHLSDRAGLSKTPEVGIYSSPELNAFATGSSRSDALIAVTTGLLASMNREEIEGVLAHEISHIANGDMVRMSLMQGVINTLVLLVAHVVSALVAERLDERGRRFMRFQLIFLFEIIFGFFGALVVNGYSRVREFRADSGGAALAGRQKMIAALEALRDRMKLVDPREPRLAAFKIASASRGFSRFLATHPPLEDRIAALRRGV
ncbi:MAG: protease HtpX [Bdellovibrionota bacterium]